MTRIAFWVDLLDMSRTEFEEMLSQIGFNCSGQAKALPRGALHELKRRYLVSGSTPPPIARQQEDTGRTTPTPGNGGLVVEADQVPAPPLEWRPIGRPVDPVFLTVDEVTSVHEALVKDFARSNDPISPPGVRSAALLESAVDRPRTSLGSYAKYMTIELAGAALLHSLVMNHPFHNGNKRTGLVSLLVYLDRNSYFPTCSQDDLFQITLRLAQHDLVPTHFDNLSDREVQELAEWIRTSTRQTEQAERPLQWHRLLRILRSHDCESEMVSGVGNRINIWRPVDVRSGPLSRRRERKELRTQVQCAGQGSEVERNTLRKIRRELQLDDDHGYDSKVFYEAAAEPDDFIQSYRKLLRRLARL